MKDLIKKLAVAAGSILPALVLAQYQVPVETPGPRIESLNQINRIFANLVNWVTGIFFVVAILYLFWAAYLFLESAGDVEKLTKAKDHLIYSIVAIAIALLAGSVRFIVENVLRGG